MIPAEVNGDGLQDFAVVVAYTDWDDFATLEETHFDGRSDLYVVHPLRNRRTVIRIK